MAKRFLRLTPQRERLLECALTDYLTFLVEEDRHCHGKDRGVKADFDECRSMLISLEDVGPGGDDIPGDVVWVKPPFLGADGKFKNTATEENPEGEWPWVGDRFLACVRLADGPGGKKRWDYNVVYFTEDGLCEEWEYWGWTAEDVSWVACLD